MVRGLGIQASLIDFEVCTTKELLTKDVDGEVFAWRRHRFFRSRNGYGRFRFNLCLLKYFCFNIGCIAKGLSTGYGARDFIDCCTRSLRRVGL